MPDLGSLAAVAMFAITAGGILIGFGRMTSKQDESTRYLTQQHHDLKADFTRRFDRQDETLTGIRSDVDRIKGKLDMNGH